MAELLQTTIHGQLTVKDSSIISNGSEIIFRNKAQFDKYDSDKNNYHFGLINTTDSNSLMELSIKTNNALRIKCYRTMFHLNGNDNQIIILGEKRKNGDDPYEIYYFDKIEKNGKRIINSSKPYIDLVNMRAQYAKGVRGDVFYFTNDGYITNMYVSTANRYYDSSWGDDTSNTGVKKIDKVKAALGKNSGYAKKQIQKELSDEIAYLPIKYYKNGYDKLNFQTSFFRMTEVNNFGIYGSASETSIRLRSAGQKYTTKNKDNKEVTEHSASPLLIIRTKGSSSKKKQKFREGEIILKGLDDNAGQIFRIGTNYNFTGTDNDQGENYIYFKMNKKTVNEAKKQYNYNGNIYIAPNGILGLPKLNDLKVYDKSDNSYAQENRTLASNYISFSEALIKDKKFVNALKDMFPTTTYRTLSHMWSPESIKNEKEKTPGKRINSFFSDSTKTESNLYKVSLFTGTSKETSEKLFKKIPIDTSSYKTFGQKLKKTTDSSPLITVQMWQNLWESRLTTYSIGRSLLNLVLLESWGCIQLKEPDAITKYKEGLEIYNKSKKTEQDAKYLAYELAVLLHKLGFVKESLPSEGKNGYGINSDNITRKNNRMPDTIYKWMTDSKKTWNHIWD